MSCTLHPRLRSFTGAAIPCRIGPTASAPLKRSTSLYPMLPACRSGNTSTLALPATALPGALVAATLATNAASACNSPSNCSSGAISLARRVASATLSTNSCLALPLVENDSIATLGSIPAIALAVSAVDTAISASCLASGFGLTAQSANSRKPFSPSCLAGVNMRNAPLTIEQPGLVFSIWKAGRMVSAVVPRAPANSPSASPALIIRQPRYNGSCAFFFASSSVIPLALRNSNSKLAYSGIFASFSGSIILASPICSNPFSAAMALILSGLPISMRCAILSRNRMLAASSVRGSSPSGKTMRCG